MAPPNPSPSVPNPKIQLLLNNVYFKTSSTLGVGALFGSQAFYSTYPDDVQNTFNIYFYSETNAGDAGSGWADFGKYCAIALPMPSIGGTYITGTIFNNPRLLWHEICHGLGFLGDNYNVAHNNNVNVAVGGYIPDDATVDAGLGAYSCSAPTGPNTPANANNNVMGNSNCREVLSARQIAAFHYLVAADVTKKYTQFNGVAYPYQPNFANAWNYTLSGTQIITVLPNNNTFDLITIPTGSDITFLSMNILARQDAKIIVEKGAKLTIQCTNIVSSDANVCIWKGIEVWGDAALAQTPLDQGYLIIENSEISGAETAISVGMRQSGGVFVASSGGGIVEASFSIFTNNYIDVEFAPYIRYSRSYVGPATTGFAPVANLSMFSRSSFLSNYCAYIPKFACAVLNDVHGVQFLSCDFISSNSFPYRSDHNVDYGIYSLNSTFIMKRINSFSAYVKYFKNGIYASGTTYRGGIVVDQYFIEGCIYNGIFFTNVHNPRITRNAFTIALFTSGQINRAGVYLNNCTGYTFEGNTLWSGSANTTGAYIRQSGPYPNSVYNNTFTGNDVGLSVLGKNYDPQNSNTGLMINCNNFNGGYDVVLLKSGKSLNAPNLTGIAATQGLANTSSDFDKVRNTYTPGSCPVGSERK
ncbi:MAG: hypothetical protein ACRC3B_00190, partial [Bacteroidia bacterium]